MTFLTFVIFFNNYLILIIEKVENIKLSVNFDLKSDLVKRYPYLWV